MATRIAELAVRYGCELIGDPDLEVSNVGTLQGGQSGSISFLANPAYRKYLASTGVSAVILLPDAAAECPVASLVTDNPYATYAAIAAELHPEPQLCAGVHPAAVIAETAEVPESCEISPGVIIGDKVQLGERVFVGPNCVLADGVSIGDDTRLVASVTLYRNVKIGDRCIIHASTVIGSDGFGIAQTATGWLKVPQVGSVLIGNDVEIGASCTVDRGAIADTCIGNGVKLDNQVQIAHNVVVGDHTAFAAQSGVSGSSTVGARCMVGGQTAISGHLSVGDDVFLMGRSAVSRSIPNAGTYSSVLSVEEAGKWRKLAARFKRLEDMARKIRNIEKQLQPTTDEES